MFEIKVKKLTDTAELPKHGSDYAAGYDLYADIPERITIMPHETKMVSTGLAMCLPIHYFGAIFARSGLASKHGIRPANCVGVIDSDYRGEVLVALHNDSDEIFYLLPGERIAQLVLMPYEEMYFEVVNDLGETQRGEGGFGSTGK